MTEFIIRPYESNDLESIEMLLTSLGWAEQFVAGQLECILKLINDKDGEVLVATNKGSVIGFIQVRHHKWNHLSYVHGLAVSSNFRKQGIARTLIASIEASAKAHGNRGIYLDTPIDNLGGRAFYRAIGFMESYIMPEFYGAGWDGITFQKFFDRSVKDG